jgi:predicted esterase
MILALTDPEFPAAVMVGRLAEHADRHGYILAAPLWANQFSPKRYDFTGTEEHPQAVGVLRDILRQFPADPDRVFLWGFGNGADFALGVGMAHPDLFAGVVANGPVPPPTLFTDYWRNAQKLPVYAVVGEQDIALSAVQPVFEKWTSRGFPALLTVYKGRGADWFRAEVPRAFDWMGRKARVRGTATLLLGRTLGEPWQVIREDDDRFYWVGVAPGGLRNPNLLANRKPNGFVNPATFHADLAKNQTVTITNAIGVRRFVIWLERDLIDWTKPVNVMINGRRPNGYVPKKLEPDLQLMFEQLYESGDRKMLYLGKIEVDGPG